MGGGAKRREEKGGEEIRYTAEVGGGMKEARKVREKKNRVQERF